MNNQKQTFRDRLEMIMEEKGLSPNGFANETGINSPNIYRYLGDESITPYDSVLLKIAALGYSKDWLKTGDGEKYSSPASSDLPKSDPLMLTLSKIEKSFTSVLEEKQQIIEDMRFTIDVLRQQLNSQKVNFKIVSRVNKTHVNKMLKTPVFANLLTPPLTV